MLVPALRRFALLVCAIGGGTLVLSILAGLLLNASLSRTIALGFYLVGCFVLLAGFFFGNRGPVRSRGGSPVGPLLPGSRRLGWATREEQGEAINLSAVFVAIGIVLIFLGVVSDNRHTLF